MNSHSLNLQDAKGCEKIYLSQRNLNKCDWMKSSRICLSQDFLSSVQKVSCLLCIQTYKSSLAEFKVYKMQAVLLLWVGSLGGYKLSQSIKVYWKGCIPGSMHKFGWNPNLSSTRTLYVRIASCIKSNCAWYEQCDYLKSIGFCRWIKCKCEGSDL